MADWLTTLIRQHLADDELNAARQELRDYLYRGIAWWDDARRGQAAARLRALTPRLAPQLAPIAFTAETVEALHVPPRTAHLEDARAALLAHACRRRATEVLAGLFHQLRSGALVATGRPPTAPTTRTVVPADLWCAPATAVCVRTSALLIGGARAFVDVTVEAPAARPSRSRAALDQFARHFDCAVAAQGKHFTFPEFVSALGQELGDVSEREASSALRRSCPSALHGRGRRPAALIPTAIELRAAATRAAEMAS